MHLPPSIKHSLLGFALASSVVVGGIAAAPTAHAATTLHQSGVATRPHHDDRYQYYRCSRYNGAYRGYSYGFYYGADLESDFPSSGYHGGHYWYLGYYPDHWYSDFHPSSEPQYRSYGDYSCFVPQYDGDRSGN